MYKYYNDNVKYKHNCGFTFVSKDKHVFRCTWMYFRISLASILFFRWELPMESTYLCPIPCAAVLWVTRWRYLIERRERCRNQQCHGGGVLGRAGGGSALGMVWAMRMSFLSWEEGCWWLVIPSLYSCPLFASTAFWNISQVTCLSFIYLWLFLPTTRIWSPLGQPFCILVTSPLLLYEPTAEGIEGHNTAYKAVLSKAPFPMELHASCPFSTFSRINGILYSAWVFCLVDTWMCYDQEL